MAAVVVHCCCNQAALFLVMKTMMYMLHEAAGKFYRSMKLSWHLPLLLLIAAMETNRWLPKWFSLGSTKKCLKKGLSKVEGYELICSLMRRDCLLVLNATPIVVLTVRAISQNLLVVRLWNEQLTNGNPN